MVIINVNKLMFAMHRKCKVIPYPVNILNLEAAVVLVWIERKGVKG